MDTADRLYIAAEAVGTLKGLIFMGVLDPLPTVKVAAQNVIDRYDATFDLPAVNVVQPEGDGNGNAPIQTSAA